jgi:PAS domain S-box-containing protein
MISEHEIYNATILIVDDQQSNVQLLEHMLRESGYVSISSTMEPHAVCDLHRKNNFDLILLDIQMPGMDGFQVMDGLKEIETAGYLPVLVITAQPGHKQRALAAGAKDFVAKPFDFVEILTRIHNMLEVRLLYKKLEKVNKVLEHYNQMLGQTVLDRTAQLRESEARLNRLNAMSSDWYWEQDANGRFTKVCGPVLEMLGIRIDHRLDKLREDQGARRNETERGILKAHLAARTPFLNFVYSRVNPEGSLQYVMASGDPVFNPSGQFTGYRGTGKDVTETMRRNKDSPDNS